MWPCSTHLTAAAPAQRPAVRTRLLAVACYLGLLPLVRPFLRRDDPFLRHHAAAALATILVFLAVLVAGLLYWVILSVLIVYRRDLYEYLPSLGLAAPLRDGIFLGLPFLCWLAVWLVGVVCALRGSSRSLPLMGRLTRAPRLLTLAFAGNLALLTGFVLVTVLALHASSLTRQEGPAEVYILYDDSGVVPRWLFNLGAYRISLAAIQRWGRGSVVVAPLEEDELRLALQHGRFIFLACHGQGGDIVTGDALIAPPLLEWESHESRCVWVARYDQEGHYGAWKTLEVGENLRFVYNAACDGGCKAEEWERALAPARVRTFDRLSAVAEHIVWLWFSGPEQVRQIE
jgi:hypothetical protein